MLLLNYFKYRGIKMVYKLMAVDIDGTLLNSRDIITEETKKAVRLGVENGLIFTISSGRSVQGVKKIVEELDVNIPLILYNGAMAMLGKSKEVLYRQNMSPEDTRTVVELGLKYGTTVIVWSDNTLYVNKLNDRVEKYSELNQAEPVLITDMDETVRKGATKVLWYDEVETINRYEKEVGKFLSDSINYHTSKPIFLEFVDKRATKALAMEKIGEHYGIKREEMIAVGDGFNDLSMIEYAGLGVAMGNAPDAIKEKADFITLSNDEDGVAHVIYKFFLER